MNGPISPELLGRLLDEYGGTLALYARRWTDQPDDCVQEALVELAGQRVIPDNPVAWLFTVVGRRAISAARKSQRRRKYVAAAAELTAADQSEAGGDIGAEEVFAALDTLPDEQRDVIIARVWGELVFEELGKLLGVSTATAQRKYEAALAALRERLGAACLPKKRT